MNWSKPIKLVTATRNSIITKSRIWNVIRKLEKTEEWATLPPDGFPRFPFIAKDITDNTKGLPEVYNKFITPENKDYILLFVHDDVDIIDLNLLKNLREGLTEYDIIGLAGVNGPIQLKSPSGWHLMGQREQMSGSVYHRDKNTNQIWSTSFGPMPKRVLLIDGLFMAINTEKILAAGVKFDEQFKFHHYDIDFCLSANKAGLKIGTWPIPVIHDGLGTSMLTDEWKISDKLFLKKWLK